MKLNMAIIPGTDGYLASDDGRIFRPCKGGWTEMGYSLDMERYLSCVVRCKGQPFRLRVHRLVLEAFVGPRPYDCVGRHLNDNAWDNRLCNLVWGTQKENMQDYNANKVSKRDKRATSNGKLNEFKVVSIKHALAQGVSRRRIADHYGLSLSAIDKIATGRTWANVDIGERTPVYEDAVTSAQMPEESNYDPIPDIPCPCSVVSYE